MNDLITMSLSQIVLRSLMIRSNADMRHQVSTFVGWQHRHIRMCYDLDSFTNFIPYLVFRIMMNIVEACLGALMLRWNSYECTRLFRYGDEALQF